MNANKLKSFWKKKMLETKVSPDIIVRNYFYEHFLLRISHSPFRMSFVLKGGFLLEHQLGIINRATRDIDLVLKNNKHTHYTFEEINNIFSEICKVDFDDGIMYSVARLESEMLEKLNNGFSLVLNYDFFEIKGRLNVDIDEENGDIIPKESMSIISTMEGLKIPFLVNPVENSLADKLHSIINHGIKNTRMKDFYDVYLYMNQVPQIDFSKVLKALEKCFLVRKTNFNFDSFETVIIDVLENQEIRKRYNDFRRNHSYANNVNFDVCATNILVLFNSVKKEEEKQKDDFEME